MTESALDGETIFQKLVGMIEEIASGSSLQCGTSINPENLLGADLGLKSLDFVRLANLIRQEYNQKSMPFQELFISQDGQIRQDIRIGDLAAFVHRHVTKASAQ